MDDQEFLDVGTDRRPGMPWRVRLALLLGAVVVAAVAFVVDRELREREQRAVAQCVRQANAAVDSAGRRLRATYEYVRPSLVNPTPELQSAVRRLLEDAAVGAGAPLADPRRTCTGVAIFPLHDELQARRDRCVDMLRAHEQRLAAVAADAGELGEWLDTPRTC